MDNQGSYLKRISNFQPNESLSKKQYVLLSLIPAVSLLIAEFMLRKIGYPYTPGVGWNNIGLYCLVPGAIIPALAGFFVGLFFRCSKGEKLESLFSVPTIIAHLLVYSIIPFFDPEVIQETDFAFSLFLQTGITFVVLVPFSIISGVLVALMMMFGSRLRKKIFAR